MNAAIRKGEIEVVETCSGTRIELREASEAGESVSSGTR
jgi:hypothetical protein